MEFVRKHLYQEERAPLTLKQRGCDGHQNRSEGVLQYFHGTFLYGTHRDKKLKRTGWESCPLRERRYMKKSSYAKLS